MIIAALTGGAIVWQAIETRKAAKGAMESGRAVLQQIAIGKQREKADIQIRPIPPEMIVTDDTCGQFFQVKCSNIGNTAAKDVKIVAGCIVSKDKEANTADKPWSTVEYGMLQGDESGEIWIPFDGLGKSGIGPNQTAWYVHLWGILTYTDIFTDETSISFRYRLFVPRTKRLRRSEDGDCLEILALKAWSRLEWSDTQSQTREHRQNPN